MACPTRGSVALKLTVLALIGSLLTTALAAPPKGHGKKSPGATGKSVAAGQQVYAQNKCVNCHTIAGKGGKAGPELSNEGANTQHTPKWLEAEIKNPKSHKADSSMPSYEDKIKGKDLSDLVAYLGSLKKK